MAGPTPRFLAHRGLALDVPENTIDAILRAEKAGAAYIETDVRSTSDGVAVLFHDETLERITGKKLPISELDSEALKYIDLGGGARIPTLYQALVEFPRLRFNIDVKSADAITATALAVNDAGAEHRVLVTSFSERRRSRAVKKLANVVSSASAPRFIAILVAAKCGAVPVVKFFARGLVAVQVPRRSGVIEVITPRVLATLHEAGLEVHVWTINSPAEMVELIGMGCDGIVTDRIDVAVELFAKE